MATTMTAPQPQRSEASAGSMAQDTFDPTNADNVPILTAAGQAQDARILGGIKLENVGIKIEKDLLVEPDSDGEP
eukprot:5697490-Prorocentrum_lima.AAC.1